MIKEISMRDIVEARNSGDIKLLNEVSLGRVYQHAMRGKKKSLAIITAWRAEMTRPERNVANKKLMQDIRSAGYGAFKLTGHWKECQDKNVEYEDCPDDQKVPVREQSFGVVGAPQKLVFKWIKKYQQDSGVYLGPETKGDAILIYKSGREEKIGKFNPNKISDVYSRIHGSTFVFEGFEYPAQSTSEALIDDGMGVIFSPK